MESSVSLSWCIRQGTRGEGDGDADYLPPTLRPVKYTLELLNLTHTLINHIVTIGLLNVVTLVTLFFN